MGVNARNMTSPTTTRRTFLRCSGLAGLGVILNAGTARPAAAAITGFFSITSSSMQPTLREGDRLLADRGYYGDHPASRGDIVVYALPRAPDTLYIKRIAAIAGDRIAIRRGRVILNDAAVEEPYAVPGDPHGPFANTAEQMVPEGFVFVLGDNRSLSTDSRVPAHGLVPVGNLRGRASYILWSRDLTRIGRWVGSP